MKVEITPANLNGTVKIPPSKSISHRAIIAASLAQGESIIENIIMSKDINATCDAMKKLGATITIIDEIKDRKTLIIKGGLSKGKEPIEIDSNESGSTLRFLIPIGSISNRKITFTGRGKLVERPLDEYYKIFDEQKISYKNNNGNLPLTLEGCIKPGEYRIKGDISSQFISGLMFVLPLLEGDSTIEIDGVLESKGYVNMTIDVLRQFGVEIINKEDKVFIIKGWQKYISRRYKAEGDFSQAAFWLVAGAIGGEITCEDINIDSLQGDKEIIEIMKKMKADIRIIGKGKITVKKSQTYSLDIDGSQIPDIIPILSVLGALSEGKTSVYNALRLRIKESDRIKSTTSELTKLGALIDEKKDGLTVQGKKYLDGGNVTSWNDHRIAMSMAIASIRCKDKITIEGAESVEKSYPNFWNDFKNLGGKLEIKE